MNSDDKAIGSNFQKTGIFFVHKSLAALMSHERRKGVYVQALVNERGWEERDGRVSG